MHIKMKFIPVRRVRQYIQGETQNEIKEKKKDGEKPL